MPRSLCHRRRVLLSILIAFATVALLEGGARLVLLVLGPGPAPIEVAWTQGTNPRREVLRDQLFLQDPRLLFRLKPHLALPDGLGPDGPGKGFHDVHTDARGHRVVGGSVQEPAARRLLCLGDSCTFGVGASGADTYPAQLEELLDGWSVVNAGVPGYTSFQGRRSLQDEGWDLEPDAVVVGFGFNDACGAGRGGTKREMPAGEHLSDAEYAARLRSPSPIAFVRLARRLKEPYSACVEETGSGPTPRVSLEAFRANLEAIAQECVARDVRLVMIVWPTRSQTGRKLGEENGRVERYPEYQRVVREVAAEWNVDLLDLVPLVEGTRGLYADRIHMNHRGYALVARELAGRLQPTEVVGPAAAGSLTGLRQRGRGNGNGPPGEAPDGPSRQTVGR